MVKKSSAPRGSPRFTIQGRLIEHSTKQPLDGYFIRAFDADFLREDDFLGWAQTNSEGVFIIRYRKDQFVKNILESFFEGGPDIVLKIYTPDRELRHTTRIRKGAGRVEEYTIEI